MLFPNINRTLMSTVWKSEVKFPNLRKYIAISVCSHSSAATLEPKHAKLPERIVAMTPAGVQPYLKLMRLDRPIGTWLLFWPSAWGIALAAPALPDLYLLALFGAGAVVMRGAGCTINDMWDRDIDGQVARTKTRPLARGDVSIIKSLAFLGGQLSVGLAVLLQLNWYSVFLGAGAMILVVTYPLMKRWTHWPQLVLGLTFNWGVLLGYSAVAGLVDWAACLPLYLGATCWTVFYDTIYAHQDKEDDARLGLMSTALKFQKDTKLWLGGFGAAMMGGVLLSGVTNDLGWPYYATSAAIAGHVAYQLVTVDVDNPADCFKKFMSNSQVGLLLFCGIVLAKCLQKAKDDEDDNRTVASSVL